MTRVIERCPNCGVEHDEAVGGECEVCGTPLRFWCRVHGKEIGFLASAECPRCQAEEQARRSRPVPPRAPAPSRGDAPRAPVEMAPRRPRRTPAGFDAPPPPYAGRDPREVAEDMRPYVEAGANFAVLMVRALFAVLRHVIGWGVLGGIAGGVIGYQQNGDAIWSGMFGVMVGGGAGLFFGAIAALRILFSGRRRDY
ncbi:hypothetical protein [Longimicrobium sp.]|uniref:hypothetical protein n=1 Tax=Longimicrobium sp. TaxID=2029185 RepID=UPI002F92AD4D